jgi:hypothetical protein
VTEPTVPPAAAAAHDPAPAAPGILSGAIDLLLRPATFFGERRPRITGKAALAVVAAMGLEIASDGHDRLAERLGNGAGFAMLAGMLLGSLFVGGPLRWLIGGGWFNLRIRFSGAAEVDHERARAIFALSEMIRTGAVLIYTLLDLTLAPVRPWLSPTILLAVAWSQFAAYQGVRVAFPVSPWKARVWFLLVPGLFYGWQYWRFA